MKRIIRWLLSGTTRPEEYAHMANIYLNLI